jgi:hypothetical protein
MRIDFYFRQIILLLVITGHQDLPGYSIQFFLFDDIEQNNRIETILKFNISVS